MFTSVDKRPLGITAFPRSQICWRERGSTAASQIAKCGLTGKELGATLWARNFLFLELPEGVERIVWDTSGALPSGGNLLGRLVVQDIT